MSREHSDEKLLRQFEPVLRFTRGERFFPMDSSPYVDKCSLWLRRHHKTDLCLIKQCDLNLEQLSKPLPDNYPGSTYYLKLTDPASAAEVVVHELQKIRKHADPTDVFKPSKGRLARVGYISRIIDALFSLSLLVRGRVRGDAATAAEMIYDNIMESQPSFHYHGRVVRQDGWVVLQYWFFYAFNNWRSGFSGTNDHEADWESIQIFLYQSEDGNYLPEWAVYSAHYDEGDNIRRHWNDPELEKIGEHPVVYVGAGSHASYFRRGEYLPEIELPFLSLPARIIENTMSVWHEKLRQYRVERPEEAPFSSIKFFRVPFVDYARGDGYSIGPGQQAEWNEPVLLSPTPGWVSNYRGLWGLDVHDRFGGENAPGGPMYNQNGSVRRIWYDPVGWVGLDKVPPPNQKLGRALESSSELQAEISALKEQMELKHHQLELLGVELIALQQRPYLEETSQSHSLQIQTLSQELNTLGAQLTKKRSLLNTVEKFIQDLQSGKEEDIRSHLTRPNQPVSQEKMRLGRLGEFWAAVSVSIMLLGIVGLYFFYRDSIVFGLVAFLFLFLFLEASFRGWLTDLIATTSILLALAASLVLVYQFFWPAITAIILIFGAYILWENLREFWS